MFGMKCRRAIYGSGFSLLEVLISMLLLVSGVVAVVKVMADGTTVDQNVENRAVATQLAQEQMEWVKSSSFPGIPDRAKTKGAVDLADPNSFPEYQSEVLISGTDPKQVMVNVYWMTKGIEEKVTLQTLITNLTPSP